MPASKRSTHSRPSNEALTLLTIIVLGVLAACSGGGRTMNDRNVATQHNNNFRTGEYLNETSLSPDSVRRLGMEEKYRLAKPNCVEIGDTRPTLPDRVLPNNNDDRPCIGGPGNAIFTQPLYVRRVGFWPKGEAAPGVFISTLRNWVYAVNAATGAWEWATNLMNDNKGHEVEPDYHPRGVNATPVIDADNSRMYVLFSTALDLGIPYGCTDLSIEKCRYWRHLVTEANITYWLVMLDVRTGVELKRTRLQAKVKKADGSDLEFDGRQELDRPGLLLDDDGFLWLAFGADASIEGDAFFHGWVLRYGASDLSPQGVFCTSANSERGAGIWQGGGGLAADGQGNVYFLTGNGPLSYPGPHYIASPPPNAFGDSFIRLRPSGANLLPASFAPDGAYLLERNDADLGAGGAMIIPGTDRVIGGGKTGYLYVLDRSSMRLQQWFPASTNQYDPSLRDNDWQVGPHLHGSPTYWGGADPNFSNVYIWGEKDFLKLYRFDNNAKKFEEKAGTPLGGPAAPVVPWSHVEPHLVGKIQALQWTMPGGMMSISADGARPKTGIIWATLPVFDWPQYAPYLGRLYAFDAETLDWLWDAGWGGALAHWVPPTVADGQVFLATNDQGLVVYGLCSEQHPCPPKGTAYQPETVVQEIARKFHPGLIPKQDAPVIPVCQRCHDARKLYQTLEQSSPHDRFPNGASMRGYPTLALEAVAPPSASRPILGFDGEGFQIYEARQLSGVRGALAWKLRGTAAELVQRPLNAQKDDAQKQSALPIRIRLSEGTEGTIWSASDGSEAAAELVRSALAPDVRDADWALFKLTSKLTKNEGTRVSSKPSLPSQPGVLSEQNYVLCIHTHAGHAPAGRPKRKGQVTRVPFYAEYWLYR